MSYINKDSMKSQIAFIIVASILFCCLIPLLPSGQAVESLSPRTSLVVVLDAGHGGIDVGAVGANGTLESDLNLKYCLTLKEMMTEYGITVIMTRDDENGLYSKYKNGFKMEDMRKRREIIQNAAPDLVISIHMNKYSASSSRGAQVFYDDELQSGKQLAEVLQKAFINNLPNARREAKPADLYVLKSTSAPSILVECGFLSNPEEEQLLNQESYMKSLCYCILASVLAVVER